MSSGFDPEDIDSFFDSELAVDARITGPAVVWPTVQFTKTIPVIFDENSQGVGFYE
jgi:hypothetical protein